VRVHAWTWRVLARAQEFAVASRGAFDVAIAPLLSEWGYLPAHYEKDDAASYRDIVLPPGGMVRFLRPLAIDLGGIAKGFAVDWAVEALRAEGAAGGTVNAGGDLRAFGHEVEQIHLRDSANPAARRGSCHCRTERLPVPEFTSAKRTMAARR
jgi:thiamine biosynthesis lipoprotein